MFGTVVRQLQGFGKGSRRSGGGGGLSHPVSDAPVVRLDPVGRRLPEKRSADPLGNLTDRLGFILAPPSAAGIAVTENSALGVSAVVACVSLIADMVAKLPIRLYRRDAKGPVQVTDHPGIRLIAGMPSDLHTSFELRQLMETGKGLGGNGYARVFRDAYGDPRSLQWIEPYKVNPRLVTKANGERFVAYYVEGIKEPLTRYDIIHVRGFSKDGIVGLSPVRLLRDSIGTALAQTEAAGKLMKNGTHFPGFLTTSTVLKKDQIEDARDEFNNNYAGARNAGRVPVLNGTFDFKQTNGMSMVDAQFIESRRFELQEIARLYRVPAFMIGDSTASTTWGTGIEQQTLGFLNFCLDSHLVAWEQSLCHTLLTTAEQASGHYFQFDRDELANVALEARTSFYQTMRNIGAYSPNDVRAKLGEQAIPAEDGGDDYGRPFNASGGTPASTAKPADSPTPDPVLA